MDTNTKGLFSWEWMVAALVVGFMAGGALILFTMDDASSECAATHVAGPTEDPSTGEKPESGNECVSTETGDYVSVAAFWDYCQIKGDPFVVLKMGEAFPTNLCLNTRLCWHHGEGAHVRCYGTVKDFGDFERFTVDVSTNDMRVLAVNLYSPSLVESENVDQWLTNCVELCNRHFQQLEWGLLRDRMTGELNTLCSRRVGDTRFDNLFIALKPDIREEKDWFFPFGCIPGNGEFFRAILHVEIPIGFKREFGGPTPFFANRYLYRTVPVTSFER